MSPSADDLAPLKARLLLSTYIGTKVKLVKRGGDWFGCCPFHQEKTDSFTVNDAKGFYHCFGCHENGDILDWWQKQEGLSFAEACDRLRSEAGNGLAAVPSAVRAVRASQVDEELKAKQKAARTIWREAQRVTGTLAERYLREVRAIGLHDLPDCLRFHAALQPDPRSPETFPAMIVGVTNNNGEIVAIQRTFLAADGRGKASISAPKRSLGPIGLGCVRLADAAALLGIAEGVETGLSAMQMFKMPVWCALGSNLSRIDLPQLARNVVIFADKGRAGEDAAAKARIEFKAQGRRVSVQFPDHGEDFNDQLRHLRYGR
jgi:DNA primase